MQHKSEQYADIIATAVGLIEAQEGATVDRYGRPPLASGYAVGGACKGFSVPVHAIGDVGLDCECLNNLAVAVARWIQAQPSNVEHFGSWRDGGQVYFDGVDIIESYTDAVLLAFERGEQAIFDLRTGETERLRSTANDTEYRELV